MTRPKQTNQSTTRTPNPFEGKWLRSEKDYGGDITGVWTTPRVSAVEWKRAKNILSNLQAEKNNDEDYCIKLNRKKHGLNRSFYYVHSKQPDGTFRDVFVALTRGSIKLTPGDGILGHGGIGMAKIGVAEDGSKFVYKVSNAAYDELDISPGERKELNSIIGCVTLTESRPRNTRWIGDRADSPIGSLRAKNRELKPLFDGSELYDLVLNKVLTTKQKLQIALKIAEDLQLRFHNNNFIHRDIKSQNIIVQIDSNDEVVAAHLIDEGFCIKMQPIHIEGSTDTILGKPATTAGTPWYIRTYDLDNPLLRRLYTTEDDVLALMLLLGGPGNFLPERIPYSQESDTLIEYHKLMDLCYNKDLLDISKNPHPYSLIEDTTGKFLAKPNTDPLHKTLTYDLKDIVKVLEDQLAELNSPKIIQTFSKPKAPGRKKI